jgi:hypothetical protein
MAKRANAVAAGFPFYITQRGNKQQAVFGEQDDHLVRRVVWGLIE